MHFRDCGRCGQPGATHIQHLSAVGPAIRGCDHKGSGKTEEPGAMKKLQHALAARNRECWSDT